MNRNEIARRLAAETGLGYQATDVFVGRLIALIESELEAGGDVALAGFGAFTVKQRAARTGRNPRTGEPLEIPASRTVAFKPAKALRERMNRGT